VGIKGSMGVDRRTALLTTAGAALGEAQRERERERERISERLVLSAVLMF
jgi:hypothetical protein